MDLLFKTTANIIIGILSKLPTQNINVDLSSLNAFLGNLNYFVPFYLIAPIIKIWFGLLGLIIGVIAIWGYIKRNF